MKDYELTVVFHPDLEMNIDPALEKVKKLIEANQGEIVKEESEGKKRLAYPIKSQDFGIYYYFDVKFPAAAPSKVSSVLNITDEAIRYLLVKSDPRKAKLAARRQTKVAETTDESSTEEKGE